MDTPACLKSILVKVVFLFVAYNNSSHLHATFSVHLSVNNKRFYYCINLCLLNYKNECRVRYIYFIK